MNDNIRAQALDDDLLENITGGSNGIIIDKNAIAAASNHTCPECGKYLLKENNDYGGMMTFYKCLGCGRVYENTNGLWIDLGVK